MKFIPNEVSRSVGRHILIAQKHSPRMLFVGGIAGVITSAVLACRATLKLDETLEDIQNKLKDVRELKDSESNYPIQEYKKDLTAMYLHGSLRIVKLYAPSVVLGSVSIGALTGSHITLNRRNASLTAAYAALAKSYEEYQARVKEELGDEKADDILQGVKLVENPDKPKSKALVAVVNDGEGCSQYARFFDEYSKEWQKNPEYNRMFVTAQETYANHKLQAKGHVFLNEIYKSLGFEDTKAGAVVGWVWNCDGDNYISFDLDNPNNERFNRGWERSVRLDFNVDGVILDLI